MVSGGILKGKIENTGQTTVQNPTIHGKYHRTLYGGETATQSTTCMLVISVYGGKYGGQTRLGSIHRTPTGHHCAMYGGVQGRINKQSSKLRKGNGMASIRR